MRLIDADGLTDLLVEVMENIRRDPKMTRDEIHIISGCHMLCEMIYDAPTVDAEPVVHARWVHEQRYGDSGGWVWRCSACRHEAFSPIISALKRCHHCGAKMDAHEGEDDA